MTPEIERELIFYLTTTGVRFLGVTYDLIDEKGRGWALRGINDQNGGLHIYEYLGDSEATLKFLQEYFQECMYNSMLGYPPNWDVGNWKKGGKKKKKSKI